MMTPITYARVSGSFYGAEFKKLLHAARPTPCGGACRRSAAWVAIQNFGTAADGLLKVVTALPRIGGVTQLGTNVVISGANGTSGGIGYLLSSTNVTLPRSTWTPLATNFFDIGGNVSFTNAVDPNFPQRFFLLQFP